AREAPTSATRGPGSTLSETSWTETVRPPSNDLQSFSSSMNGAMLECPPSCHVIISLSCLAHLFPHEARRPPGARGVASSYSVKISFALEDVSPGRGPPEITYILPPTTAAPRP